MQIEGESVPTICDSICSQQTLKIHKKYKTEEIHLGINIIVLLSITLTV